MFVSGLIRLVFFCLLVYLFAKVVNKLFLKPGPDRGRVAPNPLFVNQSDGKVDEMVQDPVCKVYVPQREAQTAVISGETFYFCSRECREKFRK